MSSKLATRLLEVPRVSGDVSDTIWRNADITQAGTVACVPSEQLTRELVSLYHQGEGAEAVGAKLPDTELITYAVKHGSVDLRRGLCANPSATRDHLADLAKAHGEAAERITRIDQQCANAHEVTVAVEVLNSGDITALTDIFAADPDTVVVGMLQVNRSDVLETVRRLKPQLHSQLMMAWISAHGAPIDTYLADWVNATPVRADTLVGAIAPQELSRRCTAAARTKLAAAGYLQRKDSAPVQMGAPLDQMAALMSPGELIGAYVGSVAPVSDQLAGRILEFAPASAVVNFLLGTTLRKPQPGQALELIRGATPDKREAWASDLAGRSLDVQSLAHSETNVALALLSKGQALPELPYQAVSELSEIIYGVLGDQEAAWEFLLVLAEEWEGTLFGLLEAANAMERQAS